MRDIVERLRDARNMHTPRATLEDAADEIARLRAALASMGTTKPTPCVHDWRHVSAHHWQCRICSMVSLGTETADGGSAPPDRHRMPDSTSKQTMMIAPPTVLPDPRDAEIARLKAERDAVAARLEKALVIGAGFRAALEKIEQADWYEGEWPQNVARAALAQALAHPR